MIRHNWFWKLFALIVAISLWAYVNAERNPQSRKVFSVTVQARNLSKGYVAEFAGSREATVTLRGPAQLVESIRGEDVSAWVELPQPTENHRSSEHYLRAHARVSGIPQGDVQIIVVPKGFRVRMEAITEKRLPVEVKFLSSPPLGFSYSEPKITPSSVAVSGKISMVAQVRKAVVAISEQPSDGLIDGNFKVIPVDAVGNAVKGIQVDKPRVHVKLQFVETPATKTVIVSPNIMGQPKFPAVVKKVDVKPGSISVEGKPSVLMELSTVSTETVMIEGADETISRDVSLRLPNTVRALERKKVRVTVYIERPGADNP